MGEEVVFNYVVTGIFACAVLHTFMVAAIRKACHRVQNETLQRLLHLLGEVEVVFGIWVLPLMAAFFLLKDYNALVDHLAHSVNYTEPIFIVVIMLMSATRPILFFAESVMGWFAKWDRNSIRGWWLTILTIGPLLGSLMTEPAAMTICALLLGRHFFALRPHRNFEYVTLALLFVNVSVGGTLTHFAAPPVLMVARVWEWNSSFMFMNFGWKAVVGILTVNVLFYFLNRKEFVRLQVVHTARQQHANQIPGNAVIPKWIIFTHLVFIAWTVFTAHYPALFVFGMFLFLGFYQVTHTSQSKLETKNAMLVGFFLAGLVIHGSLQRWWIAPLISDMGEWPLLLMSAFLTAFNDNAAVTYLGSLVEGISPELKYSLVAGAVTGGGMTVIANAPNPAGIALLSQYFSDKTVSPLKLAKAAFVPTVIMGLCFMLLGRMF